MTKQTSLFEARMNLIELMMRKDRISPFYEHTDMLILIMYIYSAALGTETLQKELEQKLDLDAYTRLNFNRWFEKIGSWQQMLRKEPSFHAHDKNITQYRMDRLSTLLKDLFGVTVNSNTEFTASYREVIHLLDNQLTNLFESIRNISALPQKQRYLCEEAYFNYINDPDKGPSIAEERRHCLNYYNQRQNFKASRLFNYLSKRLHCLMGDNQLAHIDLDEKECEEYISRITSVYFSEETIFSGSRGPNAKDYASRELMAKLFLFIDTSDPCKFPVVDIYKMVDYLTLNDFRDKSEAELRLCQLLALLDELRQPFSQMLEAERNKQPEPIVVVKSRQQIAYELVEKANSHLEPFLCDGRSINELNALFHRWLFQEAEKEIHKQAQAALLDKLLSGDKLGMQYYLCLLHDAADGYGIINRSDCVGIYGSLPQDCFVPPRGGTPHTKTSVSRYLGGAKSCHFSKSWNSVFDYLNSLHTKQP